MTNKITFTQARLKNIPPPDLGRVDYVDSEQSKLIFRISHTGNRSFMVRKRANGKLRNVTIGKFSDWNVKDARIEAQRILLELARNEDPISNKRKMRARKTTLDELLTLYLDNRSLKPKTIEDYQYKIHKGADPDN